MKTLGTSVATLAIAALVTVVALLGGASVHGEQGGRGEVRAAAPVTSADIDWP
jgi:hypothetical protein